MQGKDLPARFDADRTALVVVDIQEKFRDLIHGMDQVVAASSRLIRFCQLLDIPILVTEHYPRGLGVTLADIRRLFKPFNCVEKTDFSCCGNNDFNEAVGNLKRDQIILCGIETHVCIYQTAFDLLHQNKQVAVAVDAVSSCSPADREIGLKRMSELGVQSMGVQMLMFEILKKAGTEQFKKAAPLLKE
ncbi:MAG: hydrolase [Candidatus Krumholzibacteriota bacterium]